VAASLDAERGRFSPRFDTFADFTYAPQPDGLGIKSRRLRLLRLGP
jgi:hypothetical protein